MNNNSEIKDLYTISAGSLPEMSIHLRILLLKLWTATVFGNKRRDIYFVYDFFRRLLTFLSRHHPDQYLP